MNTQFYELYAEFHPHLYATEIEAGEILQIVNETGSCDYEFSDLFRAVDIDSINSDSLVWGDTSTETKSALITRLELRAQATKLEAKIDLSTIMTAAEVCETFGLSDSAVRKTIERNVIPARKSGGTWLVRRADAEARWGKRK